MSVKLISSSYLFCSPLTPAILTWLCWVNFSTLALSADPLKFAITSHHKGEVPHKYSYKLFKSPAPLPSAPPHPPTHTLSPIPKHTLQFVYGPIQCASSVSVIPSKCLSGYIRCVCFVIVCSSPLGFSSRVCGISWVYSLIFLLRVNTVIPKKTMIFPVTDFHFSRGYKK